MEALSDIERKAIEAMLEFASQEIVDVAKKHGAVIKRMLGDRMNDEVKRDLITLAASKFAERIASNFAGKLSPKELGEKIKRAVAEGGGVKGLYVMLNDVFGVDTGS